MITKAGLQKRKETIEWMKVEANIIKYPANHEFLKSYLKVTAKLIPPPDMALGAGCGNI